MSIAKPIKGYRGLVETCRERADELGLSRLEIDRLAGLPQGYSGKLLGRDDRQQKPKRLWPIGLESMLGTLGLQILIIEDVAAAARTLALRTPVDQGQQRFESHWRNNTRLIEPPKPTQPTSPPTLTIVLNKRAARGVRKYG